MGAWAARPRGGTRGWTTPDGSKPLLAKDEGYRVMVSAFNCREFRFGMDLSQEQLDRENRRREGQECSDGEAAVEIRGYTTNHPLANSPFVV